jgi:NAD(P)-dependent dehydrogenase (short-subunit alcohol dehydrogenase family)
MALKTVVIIGSNRGIGLALVQKYLKHDWRVYAVCRSTSTELESLKTNENLIVVNGIDVTQAEDRQRMCQSLPLSIDEVIHNAGILRRDDLSSIDESEMMEQFNVNAIAPLQTLLTLKPHFSTSARIGIVTSRMGSIGDCSGNSMLGYRVSKAAVNMIGKNLANAWKPEGITVLLLHPGYVRTDMTGGNGLISTTESAEGLYQQLREHGLNETGTFWHTNGEAIEW